MKQLILPENLCPGGMWSAEIILRFGLEYAQSFNHDDHSSMVGKGTVLATARE